MATGGGFQGFPVGVRFEPTYEELIENYLLPKVKGSYDDYGVVIDADVFELDPRDLPELARYNPRNGSLYFFAPLTCSTPNGTRAKRTKDKRGWVSTDRPRAIKNIYGQDIGQRRLFVYKIEGKNTEWRLQEFTLHGIYGKSPSSSSSSGKGKGKEKATESSSYLDLVLCHLWYKPDDDQPASAKLTGGVPEQQQQQQRQQQQCHHIVEEKHPSCSYIQVEECHESEAPITSIPTTSNGNFTALLEQPCDEDDEFDMEMELAEAGL